MNLANLNIQKLKAYQPPLDGRSVEGLLRLDFNERTLPVPENVISALNALNFQIYPEYGDLDERIADYVGVGSAQIMSCNGSDQAIDVIFRTFLSAGDKVIIPGPSFSIYNLIAGVVGAETLTPQYEADGSFPLSAVLDAITPEVRLIVICNPNNPTGTLVSLEEIEAILNAAPEAMVYVDEAYYEFSGVTAVELMSRYKNLIVTRTFSKAFGLSALRVGYAVADEPVVQEMLKVRGPYDVNMAGTLAAKAALEDKSYMESYVKMVMQESKPMVEEFLLEAGVKFLPSESNFLMLILEDAKRVQADLAEKGILTRPKMAPSGDQALRVSIGTVDQMQKFISELKPLLS